MDSWFPTLRRFTHSSGSFRSWWPWYTTASQRRSLLRLIAVAVEEHLPLAPLVEQWAQDERGMQRRRAARLAALLQQGRPLADAVEEVAGVLRDEDVLAIRFDAQSGTRTAAVRETLADPPLTYTGAAPRLRRSLIYLCFMLPIGLALIAFTQLNIVPVIGKMFREFEMQPSPALAWSLSPGGPIEGGWWLILLLLVALAAWLMRWRGGRRIRHALFGRPPRTWHEMRSADVLQKIGVALAAGRPVPGALSTLARYHFDRAIRQELLFVRNEVEQGADVWQSLARVGMLRPAEVHLLQGAERSGHQAWIVRQLVAVKKRRSAQRIERGAEFVLPALVFGMAALVVFQALTVFEPLIRIIDAFV